MKTSTIRRLVCGALLAATAWLALTALDGAARADDGPQHPGGVVGAVVEVVDQVPEPTKEPEPPAEPTDEPDHVTDDQQAAEEQEPDGDPTPANPIETDETDETVETIVDTVEQVADPVTTVVEVVTAPVVSTPTPAPMTTPAAAQPSNPTTTSTATEQATNTEPEVSTTEVVAIEPPAAELPVVIGPVAGSGTLLPGLAPTRAGDTAPDREPQCTDDRPADVTPDHGRGVVRTITDRRSGLPTAERTPAPMKPCPTPAGPDGQAITAGNVKPPPPTGEQLIALTVGGAYSAPVLHRLAQLRPRGDLPTSRTEHPEPGPA
ncbi:hypothetical protein AB0C44_07740 [Micromonospora taraxaci]|uniref:hypothetical protein n=1 Tax=Micromonospora taraxaci TaxID=1316803 RepID=UPI0033F4D2C7